MNVTSQDVKDMLAHSSSGLGLVFATDLFVGREPAQPDNCVTVFDTPGRAPGLTTGTGAGGVEQYFYSSVQIRVRNRDYRAGWAVINNIKDFLHGKAHEVWNSTTYELIQCMMEPALLDWDEDDRVRWVITFDLQRH